LKAATCRQHSYAVSRRIERFTPVLHTYRRGKTRTQRFLASKFIVMHQLMLEHVTVKQLCNFAYIYTNI